MRPHDRAITGEVDAGPLSDEILREVQKGLSWESRRKLSICTQS